MAQIYKLEHQPLNIAAATTGYKENVIKVCNYVAAVAKSQLPALHHEIAEWDAFNQAFMKSKTDALSWTNTVLANLLQTPRDIMNFNAAIHAGLKDAISDAEFLIQHPGDETTILLLTARLKQLVGVVSSNKAEVAILLEKIQKFSSDLPQQAKNLEDIANRASKGAEVDEQKVKELTADIERLKADIASLTAAIVGLGIADAICITLGVGAVIVAGPLGLITWPFLGIAMAAATTFIVLDGIKIKNDQDQIKSDQGQINEYTQDAATLRTFAKTFSDLADEALAIQANLQQITNEWTKLENSIQTIIEDLLKAKSEMQSEDWKTVKSTFELAETDWDMMIKLVGPLNIQINANDAQIAPGMTSEEVKTAMSSGKTMGFVDFINQIA